MNLVKKAITYTLIAGVAAAGGYYLRDRTSEKIELRRSGIAVAEPIYGFPVIKDKENKQYVVNLQNKSFEELTKETSQKKLKERLEDLFK